MQIPKQEKTPRGKKLARCFEDHAKAVGHNKRKLENPNEEVPALQEDIAELLAFRLDDEQADVSLLQSTARQIKLYVCQYVYGWLSSARPR